MNRSLRVRLDLALKEIEKLKIELNVAKSLVLSRTSTGMFNRCVLALSNYVSSSELAEIVAGDAEKEPKP